MAKAYVAGDEYEVKFVAEHDGLLFGPFESMSDAIEFASLNLDRPWTICELNVPMEGNGK